MSKTRSVLGRGLGALIPGFSEDESRSNGGIELAESGSEVRAISRHEPPIRGIEIAKIAPNPQQPRKDFSPESLAELTQSIREHGLIQPITVRRVAGDKYELISGERRIRAAIEAGLTSLSAFVIEVESDRKMLELAIVENVQRVELNPIEEAEAYQRLIEDCGLTQEEVAEKISKDRTSVANFIRLLKLPDSIKDSIRAGEFGMGHAKAILSVADRAKQSELWSEAVREHYSVRKLEEMARVVNTKHRQSAKPVRRSSAKAILQNNDWSVTNGYETSSDIRAIESGLQQALGTQVKIRVKTDQTGEIAVQFFSLEEFERLRELLATITIL